MQTLKLLTVLTIAFGLALAGALYAEDPADGVSGASERMPGKGMHRMSGMGPGMMRERMMLRMAEELQLTVEQQQSLQDLFAEYQPKMKSMMQRAGEARSKMMALTPDDPNYATTTQEASQAAAELASEMVLMGAEVQTRAYALLTEEQRQRYEELKAERGSRYKSWRHGHGDESEGDDDS